MDLLDLVIRVGTQQVTQAQGQVTQLTSQLASAQSTAYKFGYAATESAKMAVAAYASMKIAIATVTIALAEHIDNLQDAAVMYGYSATQIAAMKTAAADAGASLEDIVHASQRASKELALGGKAYKELGISVRDTNGQLKNGAALAAEVADKYLKGQTTAAQFDDVQRVLGKDVDKAAAAMAAQGEALALVTELEEKGIGIVVGATNATDDYMKAKNKATLVLQSMGSILVANVLPAMTVLITKLTDSYVNGGLVKQAFDGLIAILPHFVDFGGTVAKVFVTAWNVAEAFGKTLGAIGAAFVALLSGNFSGAKEIVVQWKQDVDAIDASNKKWMTSIDGVNKSMNDAIAKTKDYSLAKQGNGRAATGATPQAVTTAKEDALTGAIRKQQEELAKLNEQQKHVNDEYSRANLAVVTVDLATGKYAKALTELGRAKFDEATATLKSNAVKLDEAKYQLELAEATKKAKEAIDNARYSAIAEVEENKIRIQVLSKFGNTQDDVNKALAENRVRLAEERLATEALNGASEIRLQKLREEVEVLRQKQAATGVVTDDNKEETKRQETFQYGWTNAFDQYTKDAANAANRGKDLFSSFASHSEDAIANFITTGKFNFADFAKSIIADLAKIAAKQATMAIFKAALGGYSDGGVFGGGITANANGNVFDSPTLFAGNGKLNVMGEAGPEAVMPLQRMANGSLGVTAAGSGSASGQTNITVQVNVQGGKDANETGQVVSAKIVETMKQIADGRIMNAQRSGGLMARA